MTDFAFEIEMAQNSNYSMSLYFELEISITCQDFEMARFFSSKTLRFKNYEFNFISIFVSISSDLKVACLCNHVTQISSDEAYRKEPKVILT